MKPDTFTQPARGTPGRTGTTHEEIELRVGIEPIDELLAERHKLVETVASLRAAYGPFGTWEHSRKAELARLKSMIRLQAMRDARKMNNDQVDDEAHAHADYILFVTTANTERAAYFRFEARIEAIDFRINRGQALIRYCSSEPRS